MQIRIIGRGELKLTPFNIYSAYSQLYNLKLHTGNISREKNRLTDTLSHRKWEK